MITGTLTEAVEADFSVVNDVGTPVTGIDSTAFTATVYNNDGTEVSSSISIAITELGEGLYRAILTPDQAGTWLLNVSHSVYFPWGKSESIQIASYDGDDFTSLLTRILGLVQENQYIDQPVYDDDNNMTSGRIRTYTNSADVGSDSGVIATYVITATYTNMVMTSYKVVKA